MLKLGSPEAGWQDLVPGVRVRFAPIGIKAVRAARRAVSAALQIDVEDIEEAGDALSRELIRRGLLEWEGIGDAEGVAVSPRDLVPVLGDDGGQLLDADDMLRSQSDSTEQMQLQLSIVGKSAAEQQRLVDRLQTEQKLRSAGVDLSSEQARNVLAGVDAEDAMKVKLQLVQDSMSELQQTGSQFIDDLTNPDGSGIKSLLKDIEQEFIKLAAINPLKNLLTGSNAPTLGSVFGSITKLFGAASGVAGTSLDTDWGTGLSSDISAFAGHNASGTQYWSGGMTWVGENGPELINAPRGARISNASDSRRMLSAANDGGPREVHYHMSGNLLTPEFWAQIQSGDDHAAMRGAAGGAQMAGSQAKRARRRSLAR